MTSTNCWKQARTAAVLGLGLLCPLLSWAQFGSQPVSVAPTPRLTVKAGEMMTAKVRFQLAQGYHTNSNTPSDPYLIPLKLTWSPPYQIMKLMILTGTGSAAAAAENRIAKSELRIKRSMAVLPSRTMHPFMTLS